MKRLFTGIYLFSLVSTIFAQTPRNSGLNFNIVPEMPKNLQIRSDQGAEYNQETGFVRYLNGVQIYTDTGVQIFANKALMDTQNEIIHFTGDVNIYQNSILHRGEKASYDYGEEKLNTQNLQSSIDPLLIDSEELKTVKSDNKSVYIGKNATITTHDRARPNYKIKANTATIYPSDKITMKGVTMYAGDTPFFWLPYLSQSMDPRLGYQFVPGTKSNWGLFLLNTYGMMLGGEENVDNGLNEDQWLLAQWKFDLRAKRGLGVGLDLFDTRQDNNPNYGWLKTYYAPDRDPSISRTSAPREDISKHRYKIELKQRFDWAHTPESKHILDANFTFLSDDYFLEDFEEDNYTYNPEPENLLGYQWKSDTSQAGLFTRLRVNTFYQSDSRLPEAYWDLAKRPILNTGILHEGSTSIGYYKEELADREAGLLREELNAPDTDTERQSEIERRLGRNQFGRFHTYQELTRPISLANGFSITPRMGGGFTQYWDSGDNKDSYSSPHGYLGIDTGMKFTRTYHSVQNHSFGLDQLLHVIHPYANLSVLATKELDDNQVKIDRLTATERPRPYDVGRYSAIDDYRNWSIVRLGARNQLLTKRDSRSHSWLTLDSYIDTFLNDPEFSRTFSNLYNDLRWEPVPWASLNLNSQIPITNDGFTELSTYALFWPHDNVELELGHSFLKDHPTIANSNLAHVRAYIRLTSKWTVGTYQQMQFTDNTLERQEYSLFRNFESWTGGFSFFQRDNRLNKEYGALLSITLNALPSAQLPLSIGSQ
ncbi:LPS-assembly protein LptD [Rubritalea marina]|uniref:LPS-assembly protein LptD n=1 Tax=Rubritalea marina TaxID=361055 RepID=UPI000381C3CC|nr:LPS-assembly protein LptD [Rubritalea marina]